MVYLSGTLINGDPAICGGWNGTAADVKCFHYERITKTWKRVNFLKNYVTYELLSSEK